MRIDYKRTSIYSRRIFLKNQPAKLNKQTNTKTKAKKNKKTQKQKKSKSKHKHKITAPKTQVKNTYKRENTIEG